jgi:glycerol-3-phosphate dehydrogenase
VLLVERDDLAQHASSASSPRYGDHNLVGTTDFAVERPEDATITPDEIAYLCAAGNRYFVRQTGPGDVRWSYSGVRSLPDDGAASAQTITRD